MERVRFRSLDVFRGMAICLMIIVNTPGAGSELGILFHWFPFGHVADQGWVWKTWSEVRLPGVLHVPGIRRLSQRLEQPAELGPRPDPQGRSQLVAAQWRARR